MSTERKVFFENRFRGGVELSEEQASDVRGKKLSTAEEVEAFIYGQEKKPGYAGPDPENPTPKNPSTKVEVEVGEKQEPKPWTGRPVDGPGITVERAEDRKDTSEWMRRGR